TPKTARGRRVVALDPVTLGTLRSELGQHQHRPDDLIFLDASGEPLFGPTVTKRFNKIVACAGLPRIRLHDLRHTHATLALKLGIHPKIVSERLGHSTVAFTLDIYSHATPHMQAEAALQIGGLISDGRIT
nr:site-specific integrase [Actinomycetota bacterium]